MKITLTKISSLALACLLVAGTGQAQTALLGNLNNDLAPVRPDSIVQVAADSQGLSLVLPEQVPAFGTFWWVVPGGAALPTPCPPPDFSGAIYQIADGQFLVDETDGQVVVNQRRLGLQAQVTSRLVASAAVSQADSLVNLITQIQTASANQPARLLTRSLAAGIPSPGDGFGDGSGNTNVDFANNEVAYAFDTNQLWLEITNVSNGWSYLTLHNSTNKIYAIWGTTNLALPFASWNVETEVWPTDINCQPFSVANYGSPDLFLRAEDWTSVDSDQDGVPDWWAWEYFGNVNLTDTNLDYSGNGNTFLLDYTSSNTPTVFQFTNVEVANNYVNTSQPTVQLDVAGTPYYIATLIDDNNFSNAVWNTYSGSIVTVNLGSVQGWHEVWIGLRGHADASTNAVWQWKRLKLDTTPPALFITTPTNGTVAVPLIQLTGYSPEPLDRISYDLTNALGLVTNQDAGITSQYYDTTTGDFTTNYFECVDVPLTNGVNVITIQATDLAGNVTLLATNITVDYSGKTNPVVQLTMPLDGMQIMGDSFTVRGQVDDPTVTVTATITDTNGDANVVSGLVERDGRFWVENIPLNSGTNCLSLTVSNVVGQTTTTNISLVRGAITLTINPMTDDSQLWQPTVSVGGTVSDASYAVWVNGVAATVTPNTGDAGGTWSADSVPTTAGGAAIFDLTAYPPGEAPAAGSGGGGGANCCNPQTANSANLTADSDKPARLYLESYSENDSGSSSAVFSGSWPWTFNWVMTNSCYWTNNGGGGGSSWWKVQYGNDDGNGGFENVQDSGQMNDSASEWPTVAAGTDIRYNFIESTGWGDPYSSDTNNWTNTWSPRLVNEHCNVQLTVGTTAGWPYQWLGSYYPAVPENQGQYGRTADAVWKLQTGGKALPQRQNLFQLSGSATEILDKHAYAGYGGTLYPNPTPNQPILMQNVIIDGQPLGSDGNQWRLYADNTTNDVTPRVKNKDFYTFNVDKQKYKLTITANNNPLSENRIRSGAHFCVGQKIAFQAVFSPSVDGLNYTAPAWNYTADYINNHWTDANGCEQYNIAPIPAMSNPTTAWFYNKKTQDATANLGMYCKFNNSQSVYLVRRGKFNVFTPSVAWSQNSLFGGFNVSGSLLWLSLGTPSGNDNDGAAQFSADVNSKFPGAIGMTQLVKGEVGFGFPDGGLSTDGKLFLDGSLIYSQTYKDLLDRGRGFFERATDFTDCPGALEGNNYTTLHISFNTFVRFCPTGSDSIWVTLGRADWAWDAEAAYDSGGNAILPVNHVTQPIFTLSNQFPPTWYGVEDAMSKIKDFFWYLLFGAP